MAIVITPEEIEEYGVQADRTKVERLMSDAIAQADAVAPGISQSTGSIANSAAAILRGAIVRWLEGGFDGKSSESNTAGPFSQNTSYMQRTASFLLSEEKKLRALMDQNKHKAFAVKLTDGPPECHDCGICQDRCLGWWQNDYWY